MPQASRRTLLAGAMVVAATASAAADDKVMQPIEGKKGATILGPRDPARANENPDFLQPPASDHSALPNLRYSFAEAHFVENTGNETLRFLELFNAPRFLDVSLTQWMALTLHELVQAHLNVSRDLIDALPTVKHPIV